MSQDVRLAVRQDPADVPKRSGLDENTQMTLFSTGSVLGAVGLSSCCLLPVALFSLGVTGAWLGNLAALYPYKLYIFIATAGFLAGGFYKVYRKPKAVVCEAETYCAAPTSHRINKVVLWVATIWALAALAFAYTAPLFLDM